MKRKIKFRGKASRKDKDMWLYGDLIKIGNSYHILGKDDMRENGHHITQDSDIPTWVDKETIGQFTGLLDKNGKEIYEGDILRGDEYPFNCDGVDNYFAEVVWCDNVCSFYRITIKNPNSTVSGISHGNWEPLDIDDIKSFEVIGNIHENKLEDF